jgi:hypothetical protein
MSDQAILERAIDALSRLNHARNEEIAFLRLALEEARAIMRDQERLIDLLRQGARSESRN